MSVSIMVSRKLLECESTGAAMHKVILKSLYNKAKMISVSGSIRLDIS